MTYNKIIEKIKNRIKFNQDKIKFIDDKYIRAFAPKGYKSGISYNDYDAIHGIKEEYSIDKYLIEKEKIQFRIDCDKRILDRFNDSSAIENYLSLIENNADRVGFLKVVFDLTQPQIAELMGYSNRQIQRLYKKYKENNIS